MENFETQPSEVKPTPLTTEKYNMNVDTYITFCKSGIFIIKPMKAMINVSIKNKTKANTIALHSIIIIVEILPFILRYILIFYLKLRSIAIFFNEKMNSYFI